MNGGPMRPGQRRHAAFGLPEIANTPGVQSSSLILPGSILQKEVVSKTVRLANGEASALSISEPCTAVDVYVDVRNVPITSDLQIFYVRIYAIVGGLRIVVARGRFTNGNVAREFDRFKLVASARCSAPRFEVTVTKDFLGFGDDVSPTEEVEFPISAIGYQAGSEPQAPPLQAINVWDPLAAQARLHVGEGELVEIHGTNAEAAGGPQRFIQLWDTSGLIGAAGAFLIDETVTDARGNWRFDYNTYPLRFEQGLAIGNSTTTTVFTPNLGAAGVIVQQSR